jgi:large conductance mechanosensitive channel
LRTPPTKERAVRQLLTDFKKFILRGSVLDVAVAFVVGVAFNAVVLSFANDVVMGFIGAIFGKPNFNNLAWNIQGCKTNAHDDLVCKGTVAYGAFITAIVNFVIVAFAVFIFIKTFEKLQSMRAQEEPEPEPLTRTDELLTEIRDALVERP